MSASVSLGQPLCLVLVDAVTGAVGEAATEARAQPAGGRPLTPAAIQQAVGQNLGGEGALAAAEWDFGGCELGGTGLFLPASAIKDARRRAVVALLAARAAVAARTAEGLAAAPVLPALLEEVRRRSGGDECGQRGALPLPLLRVLCRSAAQVEAALALPWLSEVILDFLEVGSEFSVGGGSLV